MEVATKTWGKIISDAVYGTVQHVTAPVDRLCLFIRTDIHILHH